ncbi:MAG: hypothetical protein JW963_00735 [Anaerolineales bacterium]|nr:hypothetical protein [Anaerolineales bacterium]
MAQIFAGAHLLVLDGPFFSDSFGCREVREEGWEWADQWLAQERIKDLFSAPSLQGFGFYRIET